MPSRLSGTLYTLEDHFMYLGPLLRSAPHAHGEAAFAAVLWLDGDDAGWRLPASTPAGPPTPDVLAPHDGAVSPAAAQALAARLLRGLPTHPRDMASHAAVQRMCALLDAGSMPPSRELSLAQLARRSGLSARQLREVFVRDTGLTPRAYLRWRRLRRAMERIRSGASLTTAAVDAGFADGPHFSRVFRAQFGISPHRAFASLRFGSVAARS